MILPLSHVDHMIDNHPPTSPDTHERLDEVTRIVKQAMIELAMVIPEGAADLEGNLVIEKLQEVSMWAKAGIARNQQV